MKLQWALLQILKLQWALLQILKLQWALLQILKLQWASLQILKLRWALLQILKLPCHYSKFWSCSEHYCKFWSCCVITQNYEAAVSITPNFFPISWFCNLYNSIPSQNTSSSTPFQNVIESAGSCFFMVWYPHCASRIHNRSRNISMHKFTVTIIHGSYL